MRYIEVCCSSLDDVAEAREGGARRIELCAALSTGGLTPSIGLIESALRAKGTMKVNVLIRPREGDFCYSADELQTIINDIKACIAVGVDGVVVGALLPDGRLDTDALQRFVAAAKPTMSVTFHRAFDVCSAPFEALDQLVEAGVDRLLSSGMESSATKGAAFLGQAVRNYGQRMVIMPGCGVNPSNIVDLERMTGASEFHSSARAWCDRKAVYRNPKVSMSADDMTDREMRTDRNVVRQLVEL